MSKGIIRTSKTMGGEMVNKIHAGVDGERNENVKDKEEGRKENDKH